MLYSSGSQTVGHKDINEVHASLHFLSLSFTVGWVTQMVAYEKVWESLVDGESSFSVYLTSVS